MEELIQFGERALFYIDHFISSYNQYIGGYLLLFLLVPTGIYFTIRFRFLQLTGFGHAIAIIRGKYDKKDDTGDINHFRALTTALSATVGTGNIVGVALAIYYGGPGAIFWMWITGFFGMMLKLVECTLGQIYRRKHEDGSIAGGPMYYMQYGLKGIMGKYSRWLALVFAFATILCSFGTGNMAQSNSMADILNSNYDFPTLISGIVITILVLLVIVGGIKRIAEVTARLVPFMAFFYLLGAGVILVVGWQAVPGAMAMIFTDAFTGTAAKGGFLGSAFIIALRYGVARGLFSNEAGQGSAAIAHSAAKTEHPMREGLVAALEPFIDTICVCTLTALVIISTGAWTSGEEGITMTAIAFTKGLEPINMGAWGQHIVAATLVLFAFSTMISWSYYGSQATAFIFGWKNVIIYRYVFGLFVFLGALGKIDIVWNFVDMVITFMTIPNLIALILLAPVVHREIKKYFSQTPAIKK